MPWNSKVFGAVEAGLHNAAKNGQFVPHDWIKDVQSRSGGHTVYACGWGVVGWYVAVMIGGADWAKRMLPIGSTQEHVDTILRLAGLTSEEIKSMDPVATWEAFDSALYDAYQHRNENWSEYIFESKRLARFFVSILNLVSITETDRNLIPFAVAEPRKVPLVLEDPIFQ